MIDIPDDIRKAAEDVLDDIDGYGYAGRAEAVARALMNERERCARTVFRLAAPEQGASMDKWAIESIKAIRRGDNPDA